MLNSSDNKQVPPGPAEAYDLNTSDESFALIARLFDEYGDIVRVKSKTRKSDSYLINKPELINHVLLKNYLNYKKGPGFELVKMLLGNGIIVSDGDHWRKQRRMIQPAFSRSMIASQVEMVQQCNRERLKKWQDIADNKGIIDISFEASDLALDIILRLLFSDDVDTILNETGSNPFAFLTDEPSRDMKLVLKFRGLMSLLLELIEKRRASTKEYNDFLAVFMAARDKDSGEGMSDKELLDELMTMIVAGHETSAITLTWVWYFIAKYQSIDQGVQDEVSQADIKQNIEFTDLDKLPFIRQVTEEALRLYPPVWLFSRKAIKADHLGEYAIPAGADIFISPYYLHRNTKYWQEPESYQPERFSLANKRSQHNFSYIPFSAGPRRCIGDFFAIVEMQIHLGIMAPEFQFSLIDNKEPELDPSINMRTRNPILLNIRRR